jgi:hypothetical protein
MEIPEELKTLYRHWEYHTNPPALTSSEADLDNFIVKGIEDFAIERMRIWEKKYTNQKLPYTEDKILQTYRFCNIHRELDKQTIQVHTRLKDLRDNFPIWLLNIAYLRFVCKPETVVKTGLLSFDKTNNEKVYTKLKELDRPKYGTAYIFPISTIQKSKYPNREDFFCRYLPIMIPQISKEIEKFDRIGVKEALGRVLPIFGFNMYFHWTEILIDIAYQYPEYIDLFKRFPIGPGSMPTMKLLSNLDPELTNLELSKIDIKDFPYLAFNGKNVYLSAENWEGIGCEYRKYTNLKNGEGRRRKYI